MIETSIHSKIFSSEKCGELCAALRKEGKRLVLCNGHFNVIHPGHMRYFSYARQIGDVVIANVYAENAIPKEYRNTFYSQKERAIGIASHNLVDFVVQSDKPIIEIISDLKPHFYLMGKEHEKRLSELEPERVTLEKIGGKIIFSSGEVKYSNSTLMADTSGNLQDQKITTFLNNCQKHSVDLNKIKKHVESLKKIKILVFGDTIVDSYNACDALGLSSEAPVMVVKELESRQFLGGAGIVAKHVKSMGADCTYVSVIGDDEVADFVEKDLKNFGVKSFLLRDTSRPTTYKTRYLVERQKVFRVSRLKDHLLSQTQEAEILKYFEEVLPQMDGLIISDFVYGVVTLTLIQEIKKLAKKNNLKVFGDTQCSSQVGDVSKFTEITLITPTEKEARVAMSDSSSGLEPLALALMNKTNNDNIAITLNEQGLLLYSKKADGYVSEYFPALAVNPVDTAGAGDAMLTGFSLGLSSGLNVFESCFLASCMSALTVMRMGNIPLTAQEIIVYMEQLIKIQNSKLTAIDI